MISKINEIKFNSIFQEEADFFKSFKPQFVEYLSKNLGEKSQCKSCVLDKQFLAQNIYKALFDPYADCYEKSFCCIKNMKENGLDVGFFFSELMYKTITAFISFKKDESSLQTQNIVELCSQLQESVETILSDTNNEANKNLNQISIQNSSTAYFQNMQRLNRDIKLFIHTNLGTCSTTAPIIQIGENSIVVVASDEQISMVRQNHNAFILKNEEDEKNYSAKASILCTKERKLLIENIHKLSTSPLLSRKYPRASIIHASLVHIANEHEYITGNMLDISEGGIGIMSSSKSQFEKGQDIVAFVSYEDEDQNFKFSFEANGVVTSVIGKHNAFRYGVQLELEEQEKELVKTLVELLNN